MTLKLLCGKTQNGFNKYLEYISLLAFSIISLLLYFKNYMSYIFLLIAVIIGLTLFIIISKYFSNYRLSELQGDLLNQKPSSFIAISSAIFFIFYSLSLLTLPDGFYTKTIWYYLFVSICAGNIATDIMFVESKYIWKMNLFKSVLLFLNLSLSNQLVYPLGISNPDSFYHIFDITVPIIENGRIPLEHTYTYFPMHHLLTSMVALIANISPPITYNYLGSTIMSLSPIFAFLVGQKIFNRRVGLLSALIYCCSDYLIYWSSHPVQLSYVYPMILIVFMIISYIFKNQNANFVLLYLILCIYIVFLHHYSALIFFFTLIPIMLVEFAQKMKQKKYIIKSFGLSTTFALMLLAQWIYYSNVFGAFVDIISIYKNAFTSDISSNVISQTYYDTLSIKTLFINEIGSCILILFSTIGFFYLLRHRFLFGDIIASLFVLFMSLIVIGTVIKVSFLLPNRIYAFMEELSMIYLMSVSIIWIVNNKNSKYMKGLIVIIITIFQFSSASSTIAGFETSPFVGEQAYWKFYETSQEKSSALWGEDKLSHKEINHTLYISPGFFISPDTSSKLSGSYDIFPLKEKRGMALIDLNNISSNSYVFFSEYDVNIGFVYGRVIDKSHVGSGNRIKIDPNIRRIMNNDIFIKRIYNNGMIYIYDR